MDELASLARLLRIGFARKLSADGIFFVRQPCLSTMDRPRAISLDRHLRGIGIFTAVMQRPRTLRLGVDRWLCRRVGFPANGLGECRVVSCAVPVLP